jgi:serine/threonine protein kinase
MDRLTVSPHVIDLFAYCGTTILTEFAPQDLSSAVNSRYAQNQRQQDSSPQEESPRNTNIFQEEDNLHDTKARGSLAVNNHSWAGHLKTIQKLDLALQAAKAVQSLHENDIIHADLTSSQFLILSSHHKPLLKINDFNRCRFIPIKTVTNTSSANHWNEKCPVRIPSAPGLYRSPEEYAGRNLTKQIDMFSLGHVLFEIWTGTEPWDDTGQQRVKQHVQDGQLPSGVTQLLHQAEEEDDKVVVGEKPSVVASLERSMGRLIVKCYTVNPEERISATELVAELEGLLQPLHDEWVKT